MKTRKALILQLTLIFFVSVLTTWYWTNYSSFLPDVPDWLGLKLVEWYGAENAEQVADLELIFGLVVSFAFYSVMAIVICRISRLVTDRKHKLP